MTAPVPMIDPGLATRFQTEGARIAWRDAPDDPPGRPGRIAHLYEEEARVERGRTDDGALVLRTDSGPLGALVVVLEWLSSGCAPTVGAIPAGDDPAFPAGGLWAAFGGRATAGTSVPLREIVELARYALR